MTGGNRIQKDSSDLPIQEALHLAKSPSGQRLLAMLQQYNPGTLEKAAAQASQGNSGAAKETLQSLLASPQVQAMLQQLRREQNG